MIFIHVVKDRYTLIEQSSLILLASFNFNDTAYLVFSCGHWNQGHSQPPTDGGA